MTGKIFSYNIIDTNCIMFGKSNDMKVKSRSLGFAVILACLAPAAGQAQVPAGDLPSASLAPMLQGFIKSCVDSLGNSQFGKVYCGCAAAFVMDKFTIDEITDEKAMSSIDTMDSMHPGTKDRLLACVTAAKSGN